MTQGSSLQSGILTSPADALLSLAIAETLKTPADAQLRRLPDDVRFLQGHVRIGTFTLLYGQMCEYPPR